MRKEVEEFGAASVGLAGDTDEGDVGAAGGTSLARQPKDIRLSEVYKALPCGEVFALHSKEPNRDCPVGRNMAAFLCGLQKEIDKSIEERLRQYTLRDVLERIDEA